MAHFFTHRIRPAGILLTLLIPGSWLLLPQHSQGPLFQVRGLIFILLVISILWIFLRRANVQVTRDLPRLATAQEPLTYRVHLTNLARRKLTSTKLIEIPPDNRPSLQTFSNSKEPGEEKRNVFDRTFCYYRWEWLQKTLTLYSAQPSATLPPLSQGESTSLNLELTPNQRGVITLNDLRICLPDPLGIFQRCRKTNNQKDKLIVLPRRYRLPQIKLSGNARFQLGGETASNAIGQSGDFTSVREYRPGDPLRHIDWKGWARTGNATVKEYEEVFFPRYGLVLDTFAAIQDADIFEEAVSVAASFASSIDTRETLLELMFIRDEAYVFSAGRGEERIDKMLEVLAGVNCEPNEDFEALQRLVLRYQDELTACICIFTGWSEQHSETIQRLHQAGLHLKVIVICRDQEEANHLLQKHPCPEPVQWLRVGHIQQDLMTAS